MQRIFLLFLFLFMVFSLLGQKSDSSKLELVFFKEQLSFLKDEIKDYRQFIQQERIQHQQFLERTITLSGIIITLSVSILAFLGFGTRKEIRDNIKDIKKKASEDFETKIQKAKNEFDKKANQLLLSHPAIQNVKDRFQAISDLVNQVLEAKKGKYVIISESEELQRLKKEELEIFENSLNRPHLFISGGNEVLQPTEFDVIVYRSKVDEDGEDLYLKDRLLPSLLRSEPRPPLVIYTKRDRLKGETEKKLSEYTMAHLANNTISLIDNTASAFRVSRLLNKPNI